MIRRSTILWLVAVVLVGFAMFRVKYEVMQQEAELAQLDHRIADGREAIRVLNAEWSFLSQPTRLDRLAKRYLTLAPISTAQLLGSIDALPMRPAAAASAAGTAHTVARSGPQLATTNASIAP